MRCTDHGLESLGMSALHTTDVISATHRVRVPGDVSWPNLDLHDHYVYHSL
ncbi:hypothetical protein Scep_029833 [Stephania cephalantha]|uniref:Uncharacterized protein n=1 Tax=Stephania cephalantha TaxID=152367 RepID=A0AAP0E223_9MAGN